MSLRYYVRNSYAPFEEDSTHEFKGHSNLCDEEINKGLVLNGTSRPSRKRISQVLNALLNTGQGGTVYCGIIDDGRISGIALTQYMKDHFNASLRDVFTRYKPVVPDHAYDLRFVPVLDSELVTDTKIDELNFDQDDVYDSERRKKPHVVRTTKYCWCHKEAEKISQSYVIEIEMKPFNPENPTYGVGKSNLHPVYQDETNKMFVRLNSGVREYSFQDLYKQSQQEARERSRAKKQELMKERAELRRILEEPSTES